MYFYILYAILKIQTPSFENRRPAREDISFAFMQLIYPSPLMNTGTEKKIRRCEKK
jgi:hypothetical protein